MKINLWGINYHPEQIGIAVYSTQLCNFLASKGHTISTTTGFPYYPSWQLQTQDRNTLFRTEEINGVKVFRNWVYVPSKVNAIKRIAHELSFVLSSTLRQLFSPSPDIYFVVSPPLMLGLAAWVISILKNRSFIFHIQDLQPEAAISLGLIKQPWLIKILLAIESFVYKRATLLSVISEQMKMALIDKGVAPDKIILTPNTVNTELSLPKKGTWKRLHGIEDSTPIVSYSGNIGIKQGLESVIAAAEHLLDSHPVRIVICGNGADKSSLIQSLKSRRLNNVLLLDLLPVEEYKALLVDSDFCLVTLKAGTGASFLPSKLLTILAVGRPVITNADQGSALHDAVSRGGFGITCPSGGKPLADAISTGLGNRTEMSRMAESGKIYVRQFDETIVLNNFEMVLAALAQTSMRRTERNQI